MASSLCFVSMPFSSPSTSASSSSSSSSSSLGLVRLRSRARFAPNLRPSFTILRLSRRRSHVFAMAPEEEKMTRRSPLDFPIERIFKSSNLAVCTNKSHVDKLVNKGRAVSEDEATKGSGTTARGRRLLRVREEKRKREHERLHTYPQWAKVLEDSCKHDSELRAVLGDSLGHPELMRQRVEQRVRQKGRADFHKSKSGSVLAFKVSFRDFNPLDSYIWIELYGSPSDRDVDLIGSAIQSWYVMGRLGAFNSSNLQAFCNLIWEHVKNDNKLEFNYDDLGLGTVKLASLSMEYDPLYDADRGFQVMPSSFHDIGDVEFQDNWGRFWVDLGTSDFLAIDVLLNCLTVLSSEYVGIQQVVFGGHRIGDWEEGMTCQEDGYKYFKI